MYKVINEYLSKVHIEENRLIEEKIGNFLKNCQYVKMYNLSVNYKRYMLDVHLLDYSVDRAKEFFDGFNRAISYAHSSVYIRYNEGKCVRYRYITCKEDKAAIYCDIMCS